MSDTQTLIDKIKHEQGQFDAESIYFLNLSGQNLQDVNSLSVCRHLMVLNLDRNELTQIRGFGTLTHLKNLSIAENQLTTLDGLQTCDSLEILNVAGNNLQGLKSLAPLLPLANLRSLCLADRLKSLTNPLCQSLTYQQDVKNNLPNLDILDNEWLGYTYQEKLKELEVSLEQMEKSLSSTTGVMSCETPTILITQPVPSEARSIQLANEEYEEVRRNLSQFLIN